mmetsp:Transcript_72722/g.144483  ORF Transcript_72722/g.144483 Transcript_72722/m.144483 type:complete len:382 (-) Transcript_72722:754-1899(-)|eukprot:CAMPEP_0174755038 /NCGR_PEP_ID=MMETSP1094-20130205/106043_1 /TAXON_ID=156173 /ORGANISM="Chrysochromulina brevifilum, Strain UTEX LB 985" /LENGTH=381 /DNA_ID=CAMNT_0015960921 /DNA_START=108 /DNA_END=1253 /DNA_ORIENTATION=+
MPLTPSEAAALLGITSSGAVRIGANKDAFKDARRPNSAEETTPAVLGTLGDFSASKAADEKLLMQLRNSVKKCSECGKACGFTLKTCNGCAAVLPEQIVHTENVFMAFVYGVEKNARFPFSISLRMQTPDLIVFDDPLCLCACHFCAIPTTCWAQDWRILLRNPAEGLKLVTQMEEAAWNCVEEQFLSSEVWCAKHIQPGRTPTTAEERRAMRHYIVAGCNFPPSQFQLHLQYFLMPWLPHQYRIFLDGNALTPRRWFPLKYIKAVLSLDEAMDVQLDTSLDEIFARFDSRVSYDAHFSEEVERVGIAHQTLANWKPEDFSAACSGSVLVEGGEGLEGTGVTVNALIEADKELLHSSGPIKTYYKYARTERVPEFGKAVDE